MCRTNNESYRAQKTLSAPSEGGSLRESQLVEPLKLYGVKGAIKENEKVNESVKEKRS